MNETMLVHLLRYVYFRFARFVKNLNSMGARDYDTYSKCYLMVCISFNILTIVNLVLNYAYGLGSKKTDAYIMNSEGFPWLLIVLFILVYFTLSRVINDTLYEELEHKYKNEKHRRFKGGLIVGYIVLTFVFLFLS